MQHAQIANAQRGLAAGQGQNTQGMSMDNNGRSQSVLGSAQQVHQNLPQVDFPQTDAGSTASSGQFGFRQDQQNKIPGGNKHPDLSVMTNAQIQAYGVAMNQKFMQFKQRAISVSFP
jgi:hypothetical protein